MFSLLYNQRILKTVFYSCRGIIYMNNYCHLRANREGFVGKGVKFQRIRRVTGYLVGTLDRFNDGKKSEESQRVKHMHL